MNVKGVFLPSLFVEKNKNKNQGLNVNYGMKKVWGDGVTHLC